MKLVGLCGPLEPWLGIDDGQLARLRKLVLE